MERTNTNRSRTYPRIRNSSECSEWFREMLDLILYSILSWQGLSERTGKLIQ